MHIAGVGGTTFRQTSFPSVRNTICAAPPGKQHYTTLHLLSTRLGIVPPRLESLGFYQEEISERERVVYEAIQKLHSESIATCISLDQDLRVDGVDRHRRIVEVEEEGGEGDRVRGHHHRIRGETAVITTTCTDSMATGMIDATNLRSASPFQTGADKRSADVPRKSLEDATWIVIMTTGIMVGSVTVTTTEDMGRATIGQAVTDTVGRIDFVMVGAGVHPEGLEIGIPEGRG